MPNPAAPFPRRTENRTWAQRGTQGDLKTAQPGPDPPLSLCPGSQSWAPRSCSPERGNNTGNPLPSPFSVPQRWDDHPLPVPPRHLWQHPQGRGSHPGTKYLLGADVGLRQLGQVSAGLGSARAHACQHSAPLRSHPAGCAGPGRGRSAQAGRGGHTASGAGPGWGQGGPRRSRGERGKGPRGRHASQR